MIQLTSIDKQFGTKVLYKNAAITFQRGNRYGIIGHNGAGKSVLLRMIVGEDEPNSGSINISQNCKISYLPQEAEEHVSQTPLETIMEPFAHLLSHEEEYARAAETGDTETLARLQEEIERHDIYSLPSRAKAILSGLGVPEENWELPTEQLSGGFRMRVLLAKLLLIEPDFLIMDEPTNHLDMNSLIWLERFLARFSGGLIMISHDRDFLDRTITHTIEIAGQTITSYKGNLSSFFVWKEQHEETELKRAKNLQDKIDQNERFVERFKSKASKATQAQSRMKLLEKLKADMPAQIIREKELSLTLPEPTPCGALPLKLENLTAGYDDLVVLNNVTLNIAKGERIAIIGPNGAGKSTLLKCCAEVLKPFSGTVTQGHNAELRFFSQHRVDSLNDQASLYDTIAEGLGENRPTEVRKLLGSFLFSGDEVFKEVRVCSGGEKSRLSLLLMMVKPGNTLLLDEPTNHLDIPSIETVANSLANYSGTVLFVSHDEFFINKIATRIIEVTKEGVHDFPGTLAEYRSFVLKGTTSTDSSSTEKIAPSEDKASRMAKREEKKKLTRQVEKIEKSIAQLEKAVEKLEETMHSEEIMQDHAELMRLQGELSQKEEANLSAMEEWEMLHERLLELGD